MKYGNVDPTNYGQTLGAVDQAKPRTVLPRTSWVALRDEPYHVRVSKHKDERIHQARRAAIRDRLLSGGGRDVDTAERWCDAWEAEAALTRSQPGLPFPE